MGSAAKYFIAALAAGLVAGPAFADEQTATTQTTVAVKAPKTKKICRENPQATSSRLGATRVCRTKAEWDAQDLAVGQNDSRSMHSYTPINQ